MPTAVIAEKADGDVNFMSVFDKNKTQHTIAPKMPYGQAIADVKPQKGKEYKVAPAANVRPIPTYSRREKLAAALTAPENKAFTRNAVNRLWAMMMGRGIVNPVDLDHGSNPPSHPELLDLLAMEFVSHKYDVKWLIREIAGSETYQRSSVMPSTLSEAAPPDRYLVAILKPLPPEQLAYALLQATGQVDSERAVLGAKGTEAQLEARLMEREAPFRSIFAHASQTEDNFSATLDQTLFMKFNGTVRNMIPPRTGNLAERLGKIADAGPLADELFVSVLSRRPTTEELKDVAEVLRTAKDRKTAIGELVWALVASAEFRFNH